MDKQDIKIRCHAKAEELLGKYFGHVPKEPDYTKPMELDAAYSENLPFRIEEEFWSFLDELKAELAPEDQRSLEELLDRSLKREHIKEHYKETVTKAYNDASTISFWEKLTVGNHEDVVHYLSLLEQFSRELLEHMTADFLELGNNYKPAPIDLSDIILPDSLIELTEAIAENTHEVWSQNRINEGWTYGPVRDDNARKHPDLLPYSDLSEGEKDYDRATAMNAIKLIVKLGYKIEKK